MDQGAYIQQFQQAVKAAERGDLAQALATAQALLEQNNADPNAFQLLGLCRAHQGRNAEALTAYSRANELAPNHPPILNSLGALLKLSGDLAGACTTLENAARLSPEFTEAHYNLASVYVALDDRKAARQSFERAVETNPGHAEALAKFARFMEEEHDLQQAQLLAKRALTAQPANAVAHLTFADIDARAGRHKAVVERLETLLNTSQPSPQNAALLWNRLAKSLEKLHRYEDAFEGFSKANGLQKVYYADLIAKQQSPRSPENLNTLKEFFLDTDPAQWTRHDNLDGADPVFLVGFPRSGTTMLDQILSSHPGIIVMEEKENLIDAWVDFIIKQGQLTRLPHLDSAEVNRYRAAYWNRVSQHADAADNVIIDKLPLDTALMGLIYRLFPRAKFIFALRDPRDAVFSCFQQTFAMNAAMYQFLSLDTAVEYYDQVMTLGALYREKFPLAVHEVRYENTIDNLTAEIEPLLGFLGLAWDDRVIKYYETAKARNIRTPSAKQVIQKPYGSSIGKWRHYETQLQPALPLLNLWVEKLGYEVES